MNGKDSSAFACGICSGMEASGNYEAREMMFGLRTPFHYAQCAGCGTLWLTDPPSDYSLYYPIDYYSFADEKNRARGLVKDFLRRKRDGAYFAIGGMFGRFLARRYADSALLSLSRLGIRRDARVLDVGCGRGNLLRRMAFLGFSYLEGIDPFLSEEIIRGNGVRIRRRRLEDLTGEKFDVVMFHHSLEHVADPKEALRSTAKLLAPGGTCLARLPVVAYAWEKYGTNWAQLDPPRHMWLPTDRAIKMLAESSGFSVRRLEHDSTEFQFWASELYARDVPLEAVAERNLKGYFRKSEILRFRERAASLNRDGRGDSVVCVLSAKAVHPNPQEGPREGRRTTFAHH
jgi:SAM-dependent methyltransferase